jgi:hypothetical protein
VQRGEDAANEEEDQEMKKKKIDAKTNAKHKREGTLLEKLQLEHGYCLQDAPKGKRVTMMFMPDKKQPKKMVIRPYRCMLLCVPDDSALGEQLGKRYGIGITPTIKNKR